MYRQTIAHINLSALKHNLNRVKAFSPMAKVMAMIKANAYGHGLLEVGSALSNEADALGVATLDEAIILRKNGIKAPIVLMEGFQTASELPVIDHNQCQLVIHAPYQLPHLQSYSWKNPQPLWLKVDTGMHRLGFPPSEAQGAFDTLSSLNGNGAFITAFTHFVAADEMEKGTTEKQMALFLSLTRDWAGPKSLAHSAGILGWPESHQDWVRPGIMLYGISPFSDKTGRDHDLLPVMTLSAPIIAINTCKKGDTVGYGATWTCERDGRLAVVAIGYGDGYPRHAKNGTPVLVKGKPVPLVGRVSMDMIVVDVTDFPDVAVGDKAILWGPDLPIEIIAKQADTIPYELLCHVTKRVGFIYTFRV